MSTETERTANEHALTRAMTLAAHGDAAALRYLQIAAGAARTLDDLVDADHPVPGADAVLVFQSLLVEIHGNAFFQRHRDALALQHAVILNAWLDANALARVPDRTTVLYAHVLRDYVNELLGAVAFLTGGWMHLRKISLPELRTPFLKEL